MFESLLAPYGDWGLLVLRLALGIVFFVHGWPKLNPNGPMGGPAGFAGWLKQLNIPLPGLAAWVVALLETVGAALLIVGFGTRALGILFAINMLVAITVALIPNGARFAGGEKGNWEFEFTLLAASLALALTGAGALSLDAFLKR